MPPLLLPLFLLLAACSGAPHSDPTSTPHTGIEQASTEQPTPDRPSLSRDSAKPISTQVFPGLAHKLITQVAPLKEGDEVLIVGGPRDQEMLEDLAVAIRAMGGYALIIHQSERLARKLFTEVPEVFDAKLPELTLKLATILDAHFAFDFAESVDYLGEVPPRRLAARWDANMVEDEIQRRRGMLMVSIGNEMYPSKDRAALYNISHQELSDMFWSALDLDYDAHVLRGEMIRERFAGGGVVRVTHPNGTDLTIEIEATSVVVSDGVISREDIARGIRTGAGATAYLPAGEIYMLPKKGSGQGRIVDAEAYVDVPGQRSLDKLIRGMEMQIKGGQMVTKVAASGMEHYDNGYWNVVGKGRETISLLDFGFNPRIRNSGDSRIEVYAADAMVTVGFGNQHWAGSHNPASFGVRHYLPGCTVTVNGKLLIKDGEYLLP